MENPEYIYLASQAQKKVAESGYAVACSEFIIGRIYPQNGKNSGYICFIAKVKVNDIPTYVYVKAWSGKTERKALFAPVSTTRVVDYSHGTFVANGTTVWRYIPVKEGKDFALVTDWAYRQGVIDV